MVRLILVRHGETTWNDQARYQGQEDVPLSARGRVESECLADRLVCERIAAIYSSDLIRAKETAETIAIRLSTTVMLEPRLREARLGEWQGLTYEEVRRLHFNQADPLPCYAVEQPPSDGESLRQLQTRVMAAVQEIAARHSDESVLLVTHGACLRALICGWLGIELSAYWKLRFDSGSVSEASVSPAGAVLVRLNDTSHLPSREDDER
jgi:broad specificity phosphatase PhoE